MNSMKQAHFFALPSQGNLYTIASLRLSNNSNKLLVATLKRQVFCFEYVENTAGILIPTTKEVSFTYIPSGAEIISIDAFNKSEDKNDFVIGITIIRLGNFGSSPYEMYLNIYSEWEESNEFNIESIAQNCLNIELSFTPYHLYHTYLMTKDKNEIVGKEIVFILSGSDDQLHVYKENKENHTYKEIDGKDVFPEFRKPPSVVFWVDVRYYSNYTRRVSAFGCECGYLRLVNVCCKTNTILYKLSTRFMSHIAFVKIYPPQGEARRPPFVQKPEDCEETVDDAELNLLVVNSVYPSVCFKNVVKFGLQDYTSLRRTELTSITTCSTVADVDFDGVPEMIVGNSVECLMSYKLIDGEAKLMEMRKLVSPLVHLLYLDITGDGVKELVVFTQKGVYILQHDRQHVQSVLSAKIARLTIPDASFENLEELKRI